MKTIIQFWPILKRLLAYAVLWKKPLFLAFVMLLGAAIAEVLGPILISYFINNIVAKHALSHQITISVILIFISLQLISAFLHYFQTIFFNKTAVEIVQRLRTDVMQAALEQPLKKFDTQPIGQVISRVTNDTEVVKDLYDTVVATIFRSVALIGTTLIAMFSLEWRMAMIAIIIFPLVIIVMIIYQHYSTPLLRNVRMYLANINNKLNETITGMNIIQQFNQQDRFGKMIKKACEKHYLARMQVLRLDGLLLRPLLSLLSALVLCGIMLLCSLFSKEIFEVGVLYAFISYLGRLNEPLIAITTQQALLQQAIVAGERIFELIDSPRQKYGKDIFPLKSGKININNLSFSYKKNSCTVLKNITIEIPSKGFVAFAGQTGSGKSTLVNLLMGYYPTTKGEIYLDNRPLKSLSHNSLRNGISIVQQDPIILADTFFANVTLGRKITEEQVWNALKTVKLLKLACSMPNKIYSILGEQGNNLSVGQKQLLAIARVLVTKPKILILDEATANIDSGTEKIIQKSLLSIQRHSTLVVIAHRLSTIIEADIIVVLHHGKIIEHGTHNELLKKHGKYWKMYVSQLSKNKFNQ